MTGNLPASTSCERIPARIVGKIRWPLGRRHRPGHRPAPGAAFDALAGGGGRAFLGSAAAPAAAASRLRPLNVQRHVAFERHVLPSPTVELNHSRAAGHQPAERRGEREQHAVGPGDGNDLAIGIDGHDRPHIGVELAGFLGVDRGPDRIDFDQADIVEGLEQARIDVLALPGRSLPRPLAAKSPCPAP